MGRRKKEWKRESWGRVKKSKTKSHILPGAIAEEDRRKKELIEWLNTLRATSAECKKLTSTPEEFLKLIRAKGYDVPVENEERFLEIYWTYDSHLPSNRRSYYARSGRHFYGWN